ncbi:hypothetical protein AAXB25_14915 [Paenibacillus lautus]|uniref:hypothetical protein n=1 Tax=Paenibacillus lautus TaxID=1401 RepID=UPI003D2C5D96
MEKTTRQIIQEEIEVESIRKKFTLHIQMNNQSTFITSLHFVPFIGLELNASGARIKLSQIYWNDKDNIFECKV